MNNRMGEDAVISDLFKSFNQDSVILFVGSSAIDNGELNEKYAVCLGVVLLQQTRRMGLELSLQMEEPHIGIYHFRNYQ